MQFVFHLRIVSKQTKTKTWTESSSSEDEM